ncbi:MAG: hypothetical protein ABSA39_00765 [Edaphobacter sp.]
MSADRLLRTALVVFLSSLPEASCAVAPPQVEPPQPEKTALADGIDRLAGQEASSHIQYVRLILSGSVPATAPGDSPAPTLPPVLIAQCTLRPNGRSYFELFANFGGAADLTFYPPWTPANKQDLFPPRTEKATLTMDFLGYTHVKPVRRQWEIPVQTPGLYRYNPPGGDSANLEEIAYYLRYLLALPTLRLTLGNRLAEFQTTPLLNEIRKEPLCRAAGL